MSVDSNDSYFLSVFGVLDVYMCLVFSLLLCFLCVWFLKVIASRVCLQSSSRSEVGRDH